MGVLVKSSTPCSEPERPPVRRLYSTSRCFLRAIAIEKKRQ